MDEGTQIRKSFAQVRAEFDATDDRDEWFFQEVIDFFAPDAQSEEDASDKISDVMDRLADERELFLESAFDDDELVAVDVEFASPGLPPYKARSFSLMPSPVILLEMCTVMCDYDDEVTLRHRYADGTVVELEASWPFGMDDAADLTAPLGDVQLDADRDAQLAVQSIVGAYSRKASLIMSILAFVAAVSTWREVRQIRRFLSRR